MQDNHNCAEIDRDMVMNIVTVYEVVKGFVI